MISPAMMRSSVDLPHPEGPSRATASFSVMVRLMSLSTRSWSWETAAYSWLTCRSSMRGGRSMAGRSGCGRERGGRWAGEEGFVVPGSSHETAAVIGEGLQPPPDRPVYSDHHHGHHDG